MPLLKWNCLNLFLRSFHGSCCELFSVVIWSGWFFWTKRSCLWVPTGSLCFHTHGLVWSKFEPLYFFLKDTTVSNGFQVQPKSESAVNATYLSQRNKFLHLKFKAKCKMQRLLMCARQENGCKWIPFWADRHFEAMFHPDPKWAGKLSLNCQTRWPRFQARVSAQERSLQEWAWTTGPFWPVHKIAFATASPVTPLS